MGTGALAGLGADDRLGDAPQPERGQSDRDRPQQDRSAGLLAECG
ncbi:hypothetical protein MPHL21000_14515 [Mycolicibacterium phlei DSM 43239 = CCUG 21000]|uniref:Uncharacterized protein n=1 Tax=Mycolicibacterium phlei DSM 43239 = CCUG 21000 TaxID=1226750 RepID=A0A5N5UZE5_MYCPH|nr:hypothetical protein MPHL21000_14515 [Mycolicibacterium phlei DSM 43239 = CCUG 21000]KXW63234.1 hypothetical protein MPHL43070_23560 [Mycolicibacterium phlei DSM 43070]